MLPSQIWKPRTELWAQGLYAMTSILSIWSAEIYIFIVWFLVYKLGTIIEYWYQLPLPFHSFTTKASSSLFRCSDVSPFLKGEKEGHLTSPTGHGPSFFRWERYSPQWAPSDQEGPTQFTCTCKTGSNGQGIKIGVLIEGNGWLCRTDQQLKPLRRSQGDKSGSALRQLIKTVRFPIQGWKSGMIFVFIYMLTTNLILYFRTILGSL